MRNNGEPSSSSSSLAPVMPLIRCALLPPLPSSALMNSTESSIVTAPGNMGRSTAATAAAVSSTSVQTNPAISSGASTLINSREQDDFAAVAQISAKMSLWPLPLANKVVAAGNKPPTNARRSQNKTLLSQIARLQTELQMQAVRYQSAVAEFRRRLAYVSARQTHTPLAVERCHVLRLPLNADTANHDPLADSMAATSVGAAVARKLGFSVLPDGTGLGGAIVTSVVNDSVAFMAGLHIFDRIYKVDGVDVCSQSVTFPQLVDLLKGGNAHRQFLTLEVARFEEPPPGKTFGFDDSNNLPVNNASKENEKVSVCCQCQQQANKPATKVTVASVAVQTLPCLNPWFLADIRTSSTAVRTLKIGQQQPAQQVAPPVQSAPVEPVANVQRVPIQISRPLENFTRPKLTPSQTSCPSLGIANFIPPANIDKPTYHQIPKVNCLPKTNEEEEESVGCMVKWSSSSEDSAINMTTQTVASEEPTTTTLSSEKTWRTSSSSTTISLPNSQSADYKSTSSGKSFSSAKKESSLSESAQETPEKSQNGHQAEREGFQRPVTMYTNSQHLAHTIRIQQHLFMQAQSSKVGIDECKDVGDVSVSSNAGDESRFDNDGSLQEINLDESISSSKQRRPSSLPIASCASSPAVTIMVSSRHRPLNDLGDDVSSWHDGSFNGEGVPCVGRDASSADACRDYRWVVKIKSDGTRRIVKRPVSKNEPSTFNNNQSGHELAETEQNNSISEDHGHKHRHKKHHSHRRSRHHEKRDDNGNEGAGDCEEAVKTKPSRKKNDDSDQRSKAHSNSKRRQEATVLAVTTV